MSDKTGTKTTNLYLLWRERSSAYLFYFANRKISSHERGTTQVPSFLLHWQSGKGAGVFCTGMFENMGWQDLSLVHPTSILGLESGGQANNNTGFLQWLDPDWS
jgi:hypothetical protein